MWTNEMRAVFVLTNPIVVPCRKKKEKRKRKNVPVKTSDKKLELRNLLLMTKTRSLKGLIKLS